MKAEKYNSLKLENIKTIEDIKFILKALDIRISSDNDYYEELIEKDLLIK